MFLSSPIRLRMSNISKIYFQTKSYRLGSAMFDIDIGRQDNEWPKLTS